MSNASPFGEKLFAKRKTPKSRAQGKSLRITHRALRIEKISFLSLAGQTVIVNRAVLPTSAPRSSAPSQFPSDIIAESLPATVT